MVCIILIRGSMRSVCGAHGVREWAGWFFWLIFVFLIVNIVVDKTGVTATSPIWSIPPHEIGEMGQIDLSTVTPVLSTNLVGFSEFPQWIFSQLIFFSVDIITVLWNLYFRFWKSEI